jgi:hypothetical protein
MEANIIPLKEIHPEGVCDLCDKAPEDGNFHSVKTKKGIIFVCGHCITKSGKVAVCKTCHGAGFVRIRSRAEIFGT